MREYIKTIICIFLVAKAVNCLLLMAAALPWLVNNYWRFDPRLAYDGEIFDPVRTEEYNTQAQTDEDYVHMVTEDGLAVPMMRGNAGVEHREVHMMVDGREMLLKFENNHLVGYTPTIKPNNSATYVFYRDYDTMLDLFSEYCRQGELLKRT